MTRLPPTPGPVDTSPLDYTDDKPGMIASCTIFAALATVAVVLRYYSRYLKGAKLLLDDWLIVLALLVHHGLFGVSIVTITDGGLGRDIRLVSKENPGASVILFKTTFAAEVLYGLSASIVRLSVLALYWRIFPTDSVRRSCYMLGSICIMWLVAIEITNFLQCIPLRAFWHTELKALPGTRCIDPLLYFLGNSAANCVIDLATLLLPIYPVAKLQMTRSRKIAVTAIFLLGGLTFVASLVRTILVGIMWKQGTFNFTKQYVVPGVTTVLEIYLAIIGACLPVMMPIYSKLRYGNAMGHKIVPGSKTYHHENSETTLKHAPRAKKTYYPGGHGSLSGFDGNEMKSASDDSDQHVIIESWKPTSVSWNSADRVPVDGIVVQSDVTWSDHPQNRV